MRTLIGLLVGIVMLDIGIVMWSIMTIALGGTIEHIPFWDYQIRLIIGLIC